MKLNTKYEVLTPNGWCDFKGILNKGIQPVTKLHLSNNTIITATANHIFYTNNQTIKVEELTIGDTISTTTGNLTIIDITVGDDQEVYDLVEVSNQNHQFLINDNVITHNCDEFAFVRPSMAKEFWTSIQPVLSTGGGCIITSTPKNDEDEFAKIWKGANNNLDEYGNRLPGGVGVNDFYPVKVTWDKHPDRNEEWAKPFRASLGVAKFAQEFNCLNKNTTLQLLDENNQPIDMMIGDLYQFNGFSKNTNFKVLTPSGYQTFAGVALMGEKEIVRVEFDEGQYLECTSNHKLFNLTGDKVEISNINIGDDVLCKTGKSTKVKSITYTGVIEPVYDLIEVDGGHRYYTNGILSSNCEFVTDDETLIDAVKLTQMKAMEPEFYTGQVRWFCEPAPNKTFLVALDPSLGTGGDDAAIQVYQAPEMIQVAEWKHNKTPPRGQIKVLLQTLMVINQSLIDNPDHYGDATIYWTVENNSIGEAVLQIIEDTGEENFPGFFISEKRSPGSSRGRFRKGLNTDNRKKLSACSKLKSLIESDRMKINSQPLIKQLKNFVSHGASYAAKSGEHDDLVSATLLIVRMLETVINWLDTEDSNSLKEAVNPDDDTDAPLAIM